MHFLTCDCFLIYFNSFLYNSAKHIHGTDFHIIPFRHIFMKKMCPIRDTPSRTTKFQIQAETISRAIGPRPEAAI